MLALTHAATAEADLYGLTASIAWLREQAGRADEALARLRADAHVAAWKVAEMPLRAVPRSSGPLSARSGTANLD